MPIYSLCLKVYKSPRVLLKLPSYSPFATITKKGEFRLVKAYKISSAIRSGSFKE